MASERARGCCCACFVFALQWKPLIIVGRGRRPVGAAWATDIGNFILAAGPIHPGRDRATPITPVEIDGAKQVWELSARYAQFRAPAFPRHVPCRSRCRALAGLARARTSHDIRPRALCTPPPKSFALTPDLCTRPMLPWATRCSQHRFAPLFHFGPHSDLSATAFAARTDWRRHCTFGSATAESNAGAVASKPVGLDHQVCQHAHDRHPERHQQSRADNRCKRDFHFATFGKIFDERGRRIVAGDRFVA